MTTSSVSGDARRAFFPLAETPSPIRGERLHILLVDDRPDKALAVRAVVEELQHNLVIATSGADGLRELLAREFSLLLLDMNMPEMDGLEMARLIRQRPAYENLPIIFISAAEHTDERVQQAVALGAVDFVQLPVSGPVLRTRISSVLHLENRGRKRDSVAASDAARLMVSEERFRLLMQSAKDFAIIFTDPSGHIVDWSRGAEDLFGWSKEEAFSRTFADLFQPQRARSSSRSPFVSPTQAADQPVREAWFQRKAAPPFWGLMKVVPLENSAERGFGVLVRDDTEKMTADQELRFRSEVLANMNESVFVVDDSLRVVYANPAGERMFGYRSGELIGTDVTQLNLYPQKENERAVRDLLSHLERHREWQGEWKNRRKDGTPLTTLARVSLLKQEERNYFISIQEDLTERKQVEIALAESEARFRTIADAAPMLIWMADATGARIYFNQQWFDFTGRTLQQEQRNGWLENIHPDDLRNYVAEYDHSLKFRARFKIEYRMRRAGGEYAWVVDTGIPLLLPDGNISGYIGGCFDMTEQKTAQLELGRINENLEQRVAERTAQLKEMLDELEAFAYSVSHDLRAPLRSLLGFSQALLEDCAENLPEPGLGYAQRIRNAARRMDALIEDILLHARLPQDKVLLQEVDLGPLIAGLIEENPSLHAERAEIIVEKPLLPVLGYESLLLQIFSNLLGNAVKFVKAGQTPRIVVRTERAADYVKVSVQDNGIGISDTDKTRIFEMFERAEGGAYEGTGIGLAVVKRATAKLGGEVGVESKPGVGSLFWVLLKAAPAGRN